jgi:HSP20 family protein
MNLIRRNDPFAGLTSLHSQLDDIFNDFWGAGPMTAQNLPAMDVYTDDGKTLVAEVQAPGFDKDDIEVSVHNGMLEIKGEKHEKQEDEPGKNRKWMLRESHASFYRSIALPKTADGDSVQAHFDKGVLQITVPLKELPAAKKVAISGGGKK